VNVPPTNELQNVTTETHKFQDYVFSLFRMEIQEFLGPENRNIKFQEFPGFFSTIWKPVRTT